MRINVNELDAATNALEDMGCKIETRHRRYAIGDDSGQLWSVGAINRTRTSTVTTVVGRCVSFDSQRWQVNPYGGATAVRVTFPDGVVIVGYTLCNRSDRFVKRFGRMIALARAVKGYEEYARSIAKQALALPVAEVEDVVVIGWAE